MSTSVSNYAGVHIINTDIMYADIIYTDNIYTDEMTDIQTSFNP